VESPKGTVRLGLLVPATGANKAIGLELEKGFQLYLEMTAGTMSGHKIDLVVEDEGDTIQSGPAALEALHDKNVVAITGVANPDLLPSIRDAIEKSQVPLLAAHGSSADMSSAVYIWRTAFVNNEPGRAVGLYLRSKERGKVGMIGLQDNFTKDAMTGLETEHSNVTERVWVQPTATPSVGHFRNDVERLLGMNPNVIFCSLPQNYLVPFLHPAQHAHRRTHRAQRHDSDGAEEQERLERRRDALDAREYAHRSVHRLDQLRVGRGERHDRSSRRRHRRRRDGQGDVPLGAGRDPDAPEQLHLGHRARHPHREGSRHLQGCQPVRDHGPLRGSVRRSRRHRQGAQRRRERLI
jgi:hypothetical protein